jgi:hypothetical protein
MRKFAVIGATMALLVGSTSVETLRLAFFETD